MLPSLSATAVLSLFTCANTVFASRTYATLSGYFLQDEPGTDGATFDFRGTNFGLINRSYPTDSSAGRHNTQWQRFAKVVARLQHDSPHSNFKLLFLGRHGEGYHNAAQAYVGDPAWNCYYSFRNGNATVTWADAELTPNGQAQAELNNKFWAAELDLQKIPSPQSFYTSPLTRCLQTANVTFSGLKLKHAFVPTVKELFREGISGHTCDRRRSKTYIRAKFPKYKIEHGFAETDPLFQPLRAETKVDQDIRSRKVLDDIFDHDQHTYISITSHSGEIASLLDVLGHRKFSLSTGAIIPVLVKADAIKDGPSGPPSTPYDKICTCSSPPPATATTSDCTTATATVAPPGGGPI